MNNGNSVLKKIIRAFIKNSIVYFGNMYFTIAGLITTKTPGVRVLVYHDIPQIYEGNFKKHINMLMKDFDFISPAQFHQYLNSEFTIKRDSLLITFDDGFESSYKSTVDVLDPLDIKALFFICSGFIDSRENGDWCKYTSEYIYDRHITKEEVEEWQKPMAWEQVIQLKKNGHMIGGHTRNHSRLSSLSDKDDVLAGVSKDKSMLEDKLGEKLTAFAYPFGDIKSISAFALNIISSCYEYNYSGVRGVNRKNENKLIVKRDVAGYYLNKAEVKFIAKGGYDWYYSKDRRKLELMVTN